MAYRKVTFVPGEFYHLYNRGNDKRKIFLDNQDYQHFLNLMYICNSTRSIELRKVGEDFDRMDLLVNIGAYCLMPNHFHILITEKTEGGVSKYMLKLLTAYTMYFNKKYVRTGKLYEGKFKSTYANNDKYLKYLFAYIHLNPAKLIDKNWKIRKGRSSKELLDYVLNYNYSSMKEYRNLQFKILNTENFPEYFENMDDHKNELFNWLEFNTEE